MIAFLGNFDIIKNMKTYNEELYNVQPYPNLICNGLEFSTHLVCNNTTKLHNHTHYEIFYVLSGNLEHKLNGIKQVLSTGHCLLLEPTDIHEFNAKGETLQRDILISNELFENTLSLVMGARKGNSLKGLFNLDSPLFFPSDELNELENEAQRFSQCSDFHRKRCIAISILMKIFNKLLAPNNQNIPKNTSITAKILSCLDETIYLQKGIPAIAKELGYTHSHICHSFKKDMGIALSQYIIDLRLKHAVYYLENTNYPLRVITDLIGIESLSYFNKLFKEKFGMTPTKYRKKHSSLQSSTDENK